MIILDVKKIRLNRIRKKLIHINRNLLSIGLSNVEIMDFLVASAVISKSQNDFLLAERKIVFY